MRSALRALKGDMIFAQQTSIASSTQQLCLDLVGYGNVDADSAARAKALYRNRSTVVHSGSLSPDVLSSGLDDGMHLMQSLLEAYVLRAVALGSAKPIQRRQDCCQTVTDSSELPAKRRLPTIFIVFDELYSFPYRPALK